MEVGYFNVSNKLLSPLSIVINTALVTLFPHFSQLYINDKAGFYYQIKKAFILFTIIGIFGAFCVTLFRSEVVNILFGEAYSKSSLVMSYQCWFLVLNTGLLSLISNLLGAMDKQRTLSKITIVGSIISVPVLWYGSKFGAENLSLAYLIFNLFQFSYCWIFLVRFSEKNLNTAFFIRLIAGFLLFMLVSLLLPPSLSIIIRIVVFVITCGIFVLSIRKFEMQTLFQRNVKE
jgi:O-antigen/teichoic acid export membrane protein